MSITIHGGRIIRQPIGRVYDLLSKVKGQSRDLGRELQIAWMARRAARIIDDARLKDEEAEHPLYTAWCEMRDRQREVKRTGRRDPDIDVEFELWLWPLKDRTLINLHTEQRVFTTWFDALPFVEEYAYWDNTDPDETVSKPDWRKRKTDWQRAWGNGAASDRSMTMVMFNDALPLPATAEEAVTHVPDIDGRVDAAAWRTHVDEVHRRLVDERKAIDPDWKMEGFSTFFQAEGEARAEVARRKAIREMLQPLIREITAEDLSPPRREG